jgi:transposase
MVINRLAVSIMATIQDASAFASGREFAAFLGLTPRQNSTGGKTRLGRITKMGEPLPAQASGGGRLRDAAPSPRP